MGLRPWIFAGCLTACAAGPRGIPQGPPPEYERHPLPPWPPGDAGASSDPRGAPEKADSATVRAP